MVNEKKANTSNSESLDSSTEKKLGVSSTEKKLSVEQLAKGAEALLPERWRPVAQRMVATIALVAVTIYGVIQMAPLIEQFRKLDETTKSIETASTKLGEARTALSTATTALETIFRKAESAQQEIENLRASNRKAADDWQNKARELQESINRSTTLYSDLVGRCGSSDKFHQPYIYQIGIGPTWNPSQETWLQAIKEDPKVFMSVGSSVELPCTAPLLRLRVIKSADGQCTFVFEAFKNGAWVSSYDSPVNSGDHITVATGEVFPHSHSGFEYSVKMVASGRSATRQCGIVVQRIKT